MKRKYESKPALRRPIGINVAGFKIRQVKDCLKCKRPECDGCPKGKEGE